MEAEMCGKDTVEDATREVGAVVWSAFSNRTEVAAAVMTHSSGRPLRCFKTPLGPNCFNLHNKTPKNSSFLSQS